MCCTFRCVFVCVCVCACAHSQALVIVYGVQGLGVYKCFVNSVYVCV